MIKIINKESDNESVAVSDFMHYTCKSKAPEYIIHISPRYFVGMPFLVRSTKSDVRRRETPLQNN